MDEVMETFKQLQGSELQQENVSWDEYVKEIQQVSNGGDEKLKQLLYVKSDSDTDVTLEHIMTSNFQDAKDTIDKMTLAKRISMLEDVSAYRNYLYESLGSYGAPGIPKDDQLTSKEFRALLGRVKHLEILQNWLYGII